MIDSSGRIVEAMKPGNQPADETLKLWNTETLEHGVYYVRMKGGNENELVRNYLIS